MKKVKISTASARYLADVSRSGCECHTSGREFGELLKPRNGTAFIKAATRLLAQNRVDPKYREAFREDLAVYSDAWKALSAA